MAILAPEQGTRTTLTPDPPANGSVTGLMGGFLTLPGIAGSAFARAAEAAIRAIQQKTADAAAAAQAALTREVSTKKPVVAVPRTVPPPVQIPRPGTLPPLAALPAPPAAPGTTPPSRPGVVAPAAGAGGLMLVLVAMALLSGVRRR